MKYIWFPGVAVYFLSPLWPYHLAMTARVDDSIVQIINVTDPNTPTNFLGAATAPFSVVWALTGLVNGPHTLALSSASSMNGTHNINIDGFM